MLKHLLILSLAGTALLAKDWYVSPAGSPKAAGSESSPFATIAQAVSRAKAGDTVHIGKGLYREEVTFRNSGTAEAPIVFQGELGDDGEFLSIIENKGTTVDQWTPAPEIAQNVWKAPLAKRPELVLMDGKMIVFINKLTMGLKRWENLPDEMDENMLWSHFDAPDGCKRVPGLDLLALDKDILVRHRYFGAQKVPFYETINYVISGWKDNTLYVRFANGSSPDKHTFTASGGTGFTLYDASNLVFRNLYLRGSRCQMRLSGKSNDNIIEDCLMMHGGYRIYIDKTAKGTTIRNSIFTLGFTDPNNFVLRGPDSMKGGLLYCIFKYIVGTALSDDCSLHILGPDTHVYGNSIFQGLIGIRPWASGMDVHDNVVREMSSVGICTYTGTVGEIHHNIITNCGIPIRIHHYRHERLPRKEYHHHNLMVQSHNGGLQFFVHCSSNEFADKENFKPGTMEYLDNPPNPVDPGEFYIYHNTCWGGVETGGPLFTVIYLSKRFKAPQPFMFANNIIKNHRNYAPFAQWLLSGNVFFPQEKPFEGFREPEVAQTNTVLTAEQYPKLWGTNPADGLPDLTIPQDSPAVSKGLDLTKPFVANGHQLQPFPGAVPASDKAPTPGALQPGESMDTFLAIYRRCNQHIKLVKAINN